MLKRVLWLHCSDAQPCPSHCLGVFERWSLKEHFRTRGKKLHQPKLGVSSRTRGKSTTPSKRCRASSPKSKMQPASSGGCLWGQFGDYHAAGLYTSVRGKGVLWRSAQEAVENRGGLFYQQEQRSKLQYRNKPQHLGRLYNGSTRKRHSINSATSWEKPQHSWQGKAPCTPGTVIEYIQVDSRSRKPQSRTKEATTNYAQA